MAMMPLSIDRKARTPASASRSITWPTTLRVERLVARLVAGDLPADPGEVLIPLGGGELAHVPVGDPGRAFLEGGVDEAHQSSPPCSASRIRS